MEALRDGDTLTALDSQRRYGRETGGVQRTAP
jgi:hypothetical protein